MLRSTAQLFTSLKLHNAGVNHPQTAESILCFGNEGVLDVNLKFTSLICRLLINRPIECKHRLILPTSPTFRPLSPLSPIMNHGIYPMSRTNTGILAGSHHILIAGGTFVDVKGNIQTCNCRELSILSPGTYNRYISFLVLTARRMENVVAEGQFSCPLQLQ